MYNAFPFPSAIAAVLAATVCAFPPPSVAEIGDRVTGDPVVHEYYHQQLDRYFLAVTQHEKADLDFGRHRGWQRTGKSFRSLDADSTDGVVSVPVCRYYFPPPLGDMHFFSAFADECEAIARRWPDAVLETSEAFRVALPERNSGLCIPTSTDDPQRALLTKPVYRAWNGRADSNHRYTTSLADQTDMVLRGWIPERYGPHGTVMCVDSIYLDSTGPKPKPKSP